MPGPIPLRELTRRLHALGFSGPCSGGRHQFMAKGALKVRIPNPHHRNDVGASLLKEILRQGGISDEEWESSLD